MSSGVDMKRFKVKIVETCVATYIIEGENEPEFKEDLVGDGYKIVDTLDDGSGNMTMERVEEYKELAENEIGYEE